MAEKKPSAGSKSGMNVDIKLVRELADLLNDTGLTEIEVEDDDRKIRVAKGSAVTTVAAGPAPMAAPAPAAAPATPAAAPTAEAAPAAEAAGTLKSPMVGTAYLAPEPGKPNFVNIGDTVAEGDTILIVEAMKVMNTITADKAGTITAILIDNAQPIEFDQPLVVIA